MFNNEILTILNEPISKEMVKSREAFGGNELSYIPAYHAIGEANRIFGYGQWSTEVMKLQQVDKTIYEKAAYKPGDAPKEMVSICYLAEVKLTVTHSGESASHEDTGFGNGVATNNAYGIASCIELASKEAVTDAVKRCLRYYGNKFGLSLYDKDGAPIAQSDIESAKMVNEPQLTKLRELYDLRGVDDEWVLTAVKADGFTGDTLEIMTQQWYDYAYNLTYQYKLDEIEASHYEADVERILKLMNESANMNMLKALFKEIWTLAGKFDDKKVQGESQKLYEQIKLKFGDKK